MDKQTIMKELKVELLKTDAGSLLIALSGSKINSSIVNTLKRVITSDIPVYGFSRRNINISENNTIYNNYMIINRIEMIPVFAEDHNIELFDKLKFFQNYDTLAKKYDVSLHKDGKELFVTGETTAEHIKYNDEKQIELKVSFHNKTEENVNITTHDCEIVVVKNNEKYSKDYKKFPPILITIVKPGQKFSVNAVAELGIGKYHSTWSSVVIDKYKKIDANHYEFGFTSLGSLSNNFIMFKACQIIIKKLEIIINFVKTKYKDAIKNNSLDIVLHQENHTMGNLINFHLQDHSDVIYSGYAMPHLLIEEIIISFDTINKNPIVVFEEVLSNLKLLFMEIQKLI